MNLTSNTTLDEHVVEHEIYLALSVCLLVLIFGIFLTSLLRKHKVIWLADASALVLVGIAIGGIMNAFPSSRAIRGVVSLIEFDNTLFFIILLPPIIFHSGLEVNQFTWNNLWARFCRHIIFCIDCRWYNVPSRSGRVRVRHN